MDGLHFVWHGNAGLHKSGVYLSSMVLILVPTTFAEFHSYEYAQGFIVILFSCY